MERKVTIRITCINNNERKDEYNIEYYDNDGYKIGSVVVDESGTLKWHIWESLYQTIILDCVSHILGMPAQNTDEYILKGKEKDPERWDRAKEYIDSNKLLVYYRQDKRFNEEFKDGVKPRRR